MNWRPAGPRSRSRAGSSVGLICSPPLRQCILTRRAERLEAMGDALERVASLRPIFCPTSGDAMSRAERRLLDAADAVVADDRFARPAARRIRGDSAQHDRGGRRHRRARRSRDDQRCGAPGVRACCPRPTTAAATLSSCAATRACRSSSRAPPLRAAVNVMTAEFAIQNPSVAPSASQRRAGAARRRRRRRAGVRLPRRHPAQILRDRARRFRREPDA